MGYVKSDGTFKNSNNLTIGFIKEGGSVQNRNYNAIEYAIDNKKECTAVYFFFFKFK